MTDAVQPPWMQGFVPQPGKWQRGMSSPNPHGRPPGPSKQQKLIQKILDGADDMVDAQLAKAKEGDTSAADLLLKRVLPTLRSQSQTVQFDFDHEAPITTQIEQVLAAVAAGEVPPDVGQQIISAINTLSQARVVEELADKVAALTAKDVTP